MKKHLKRRFIFVILPHCHLLDLAGIDQVLYELKDLGYDISLHYCSVQARLKSSNNLTLADLQHYSDIQPALNDVVIIPGSESSYLLSKEFASKKRFHQWLRDAHEKGARVCSICTGAFALAQAGLLDGRECTTHWQCTQRLQQTFPLTKVRDNVLFCDADRITTSAGVSSGVDMALHLVSSYYSEEVAFRIARQLVVYTRRSADSAQLSPHLIYRNHIHSAIHAVQDHLWENLNTAIHLDELADIACMSKRNLTRTFRVQTGISVGHYHRILRAEKAQSLLEQTDLTMLQVAQACGLRSERQLQRIIHEASRF